MLTEFTTFELSTLKEAIQLQIEALEAFNKRVSELGPDMERLASERVNINKLKLEALYTQRAQVLDAWQQVNRREVFLQN